MIKPKPTNLTLNKRDGYLEITWNVEDRVCQYPLDNLREACPCVECRGGHQYMGPEYAPKNILVLTPKRSYVIQDIQMVGNYALQPIWDDGHDSGIFTWEYLWNLCPPNSPPSED